MTYGSRTVTPQLGLLLTAGRMSVHGDISGLLDYCIKIVLFMIAKPVAKSSKVKASAAKQSSSTQATVTTLAQVTGGRGTLKRRRQLQQLFDYHQQQRDFDLFSSTPYRSDKPITVRFILSLFSSSAVLC